MPGAPALAYYNPIGGSQRPCYHLRRTGSAQRRSHIIPARPRGSEVHAGSSSGGGGDSGNAALGSNSSSRSSSGWAATAASQLAAAPAAACSRRAALSAVSLAVLGAALPAQRAQAAAEAGEPAVEFTTYQNESLRYSLDRPANWEAVSDIGADAVFEDPEERSTRVGVTVYNVSISSLEDFGDVEAVGEQLMDAERLKDGTQGVRMLWQQARSFDDRDYYEYAYLLDTTRGRWQIFSSVAVRGSALFILDASMGCGPEPGSAYCASGTAEVLQRVAGSFRVL